MEYLPFNPTTEQRANLERLAAHLDLGVTNLQFDMSTYNDESRDEPAYCGTVGCAVGHGPSLGISIENDLYWGSYAGRVFGAGVGGNILAYGWMFSGRWSDVDNTPRGAAARIRIALSHGIPDNCSDQAAGKAPLSYTVPDRVESPVIPSKTYA